MIVPTYETTCKEQEMTINELRSINNTQENRINIQKEEIKALKEELSEYIEFQVKYDIAIVKCAKLEQEIERLKELCDKYEEEHKTTFETWQKDIKENEHLRTALNTKESIIKEVRELRKQLAFEYYENGLEVGTNVVIEDLDKILDKESK